MLLISVDTLTSLFKEAQTREAAHPLRFYRLEVGRTGIEVRVCDHSQHTTYNVIEVMQYDALAIGNLGYASCIFDKVDTRVERGLAALAKFGGREDV